MDLQSIKNKVNSIAKAKNIHDQEIYNRILSFLDTTYKYSVPISYEKLIMDEIKNKILTILYSKDNHRQNVNHQTKYNQLFKLDGIEMKFFERAFQELEADGQVASLMFEISLTDKGIMTARNLNV